MNECTRVNSKTGYTNVKLLGDRDIFISQNIRRTTVDTVSEFNSFIYQIVVFC